MKTCNQPGCDKRVIARGWCWMHYSRMRRHGSLAKPEHMSQVTRAKISRAKRGKPGPWLGIVRGPHSEATKARMRAAALGKPKSAEHAAHILAKNWHGPKPRYRGIRFRSSYEVRLAKAFDVHGIRWEYEPKRFNLGTCSYLPDFYLPDLEAFWEAKGFFSEESQQKVARFRALHPEFPLVVATLETIKGMEM